MLPLWLYGCLQFEMEERLVHSFHVSEKSGCEIMHYKKFRGKT